MYDLQYIITALGFYTLLIIIVLVLGFLGKIAGEWLIDLVERLYAPRRKRLVALACAKAAEEDPKLRVVE